MCNNLQGDAKFYKTKVFTKLTNSEKHLVAFRHFDFGSNDRLRSSSLRFLFINKIKLILID